MDMGYRMTEFGPADEYKGSGVQTSTTALITGQQVTRHGGPSPAPEQHHDFVPRQRPKARSCSSGILGWGLEIVSLVLSVVAMLAVAGIAYRMDGRPLDEWRYPLAINTAISLLVVVARGTMSMPVVNAISQLKWVHFRRRPRRVTDMETFDDASRGGLGSLLFLFRIPKDVAVIGAIVTLTAYALGPFSQQVIQYEALPVVNRSNNVTADFHVSPSYATNLSNSQAGTFDVRTADLGMQGAIIASLYGSSLKAPYNCSSQCQWPGSYNTLGFAHECHDVTAVTIPKKKCVGFEEGQELDDNNFFRRNCSITTPAGVDLKFEVSPTNHFTFFTSTTLNGNKTRDPNFLTIGFYRAERAGESRILSEIVEECVLSVAAYTYSDVHTTGNDIEVGIPRITKQLEVEFIENPALGDALDMFIFRSAGLPEMRIRSLDYSALVGFLESEFTQNLEVGPGASAPFTPFSARNLDIPAMMERLVRTMTNVVASRPESEKVLGEAVETIIFVRASYIWMILPIAVELGALLLLLCVMWRARPSSGVALWKHSALALLYHYTRPSGDPRVNGGYLQCDMESPHEMEKMAKRTVVQAL